ncbi:isoamyl acetate-hydrolyzing esterase [Coemansia sp. Benny D115]|nr:isoamyl acetate-hydrolyzing esterase [Coemansia sp. Benny D115]
MNDQVICLGDSITQHGWDVAKHGWVAQLAQYYLRRLDVISRGLSGYNTRWATALLPRVLPRYQPIPGSPRVRLVTVFFGANDAQLPLYDYHVPLVEYRQNLRSIVDQLRSPESPLYAPDASIVLITPPPVGEKMWARVCEEKYGEKVLDRQNAVTRQYAEAAVSLADELGLPVVDMWTAIEERVRGSTMPFEGYEEYTSDGLHLNAKGNDLLASLLIDTVEKQFPELEALKVPFVLPYHADIAGKTLDEVKKYLQR